MWRSTDLTIYWSISLHIGINAEYWHNALVLGQGASDFLRPYCLLPENIHTPAWKALLGYIPHPPHWNFLWFFHRPKRLPFNTKRQKLYLHDLFHRDRGDYRGLQGVTGGYKGLQRVTRRYRELQRVTGGYKGLKGVTPIYRRLQGVTGGYRGLKGLTRVTEKLFSN